MSVPKIMKRRIWWSLGRFILFVLGLITTGLTLGFFVFAISVSRLTTPSSPPKADGIVVWTGKGGDRVQSGVSLLRAKQAERLLISGTNANLSRETILSTLGLPDELADCCVDMDQAKDTVDNAQQTANWAKALGYDHIILVTSAYHMPRAEIEIGTAAGRLGITSYPIRGSDEQPWWRDGTQFKRMVQEYGKLVLSFIRNNHARGTPPARLQKTLPDDQD